MSGSRVRRAGVFPAVLAASALAAVWLQTGHAAPKVSSAPPPRRTSSPPATSAPSSRPPAPPPKRRNTAPFWLREPDGGKLIVYPPKKPGKQPLAVLLHGMCDVPENECPWFAPAVTPHAWLVCPRASVSCRGGGAMWSGQRMKTTVKDAVRGLIAARPGQVDTKDATLMGFSQGAYMAFSIARSEPGKWSRLLLIAAKVYPSARRLRRHGVQRVLFAAGDYDMTHNPMRAAARNLSRSGYPARFMSLGKVGHTFPDDMTKRMSEAVAWLKL